MVRDQPDPPFLLIRDVQDIWGISSAGRAPALQAGGRRFDPVILHQSKRESSIKRFGVESGGFGDDWLVSITAEESQHGCSLKIHRVEISVADGKHTFVKV